MKRLFTYVLLIALLIPAALFAAVPAKPFKPPPATPKVQLVTQPNDSLQQPFNVSTQKPLSMPLYITAPGAVTLDLSFKGDPVAVYLRTATGQVLATVSSNQPVGRLLYTVTQNDLQSGYTFNLSVTTRGNAAGTLQAVFPKVNRTLLDASLSNSRIPVPSTVPKVETVVQAAPAGTAPPKPAQIMEAGARSAVIKGNLGIKVSRYPDTGSDSVPDVTDWRPKARVPAGGELIVQGRNLRPSQLNVYVGDTRLTATTQMAHEMRFTVPAAPLASGASLVAYHIGGQVRTLDAAYSIYNPNVTISRVQPASFSPGDMVTVHGTSLFDTMLLDSYYASRVEGIPVLSTIQQVQTTGSFIKLGNYKVKVLNPQVSAAGDTLTFMVDNLYEFGRACLRAGYGNCSTPDSIISFLHPVATVPPSVTGDLKIPLKGTKNEAFGSAATWQQGGPKIRKVYGRFFGLEEPFVILPTPEMGQSITAGSAVIEGGNLYNASYRIGSMTINGYSMPLPEDGTKIWLNIPLNASDGLICGTRSGGGASSCSTAPLKVFGGPTITRVPVMPLTPGVRHTIEGINLLPPSIPGLTYTFKMFGQESNPGNIACNDVLEVLEHTSTRIVFRVGDPAKQTILPAGCGTGAAYSPPANINTTSYKMSLWASYQGRTYGIWNKAFYLKPWDLSAAPQILKFEGRSDVGSIDAAVSGNSIATPVSFNLGSGKSATLTWDLGRNSFDSADISGIGPVTTAAGSVTISPNATQRYVLSVRKGQMLVQKALDVMVGTPPSISSFDCLSLINPPPAGISYFRQGGQGGEMRWNVGYSWTLIEINPGGIYRKTRNTYDPNSADSGSRVVNPAQQTTYTLSASNAFGTNTKSCTLAPLPPTRLVEYTITPMTIRRGESAVLSWRIEGLPGYVSGSMQPTFLPSGSIVLPSTSGSVTISPQVTQPITLEASGYDTLFGPKQTRTLTIQVTP